MRDINRIEPFIEQITDAWKKVPDQRFGQFMSNILGVMASRHGDPFFWEEDEFIKYMNEIEWLKK